ncbi:MAG TPA: choice-of-anchor tandem repeat GloVer-containing protein [Verrucomicrobiae bacterium]|nr:choice-of-anchor tandem repeat GloVer-containing protein [Verrucomicrobiae bacterium]
MPIKSPKTSAVACFLLALCLASLSAHGQAAFTSMASFTYTNLPDYGSFGAGYRSAAMVQANDGNLYGATPTGGPNTNVPGYFGTLFKMTPDGAFSTLYLFGTDFNPNTGFDNGHWPQGNLIQGTDDFLYGTTQFGGAPNGGTIFQISTEGDLYTLYTFGGNAAYDSQLSAMTNYDGASPVAGLVQGRDGNFYGTTYNFGPYGNGTIFQLTPSITFLVTNLHSFTALDPVADYENADGANPIGELIQGKDGSFYGTTTEGGTNAYGAGTVFKITTGGLFTTLHSFSSADGSPIGGLVQANDGNLYGTISGGFGAIFRISTNGTFTRLHTFSGPDGLIPYAALILGSDGNLYGTTDSGGSNGGYGTVFQMTTNGVVTTLHAFNGSDGSTPTAALVQASDGSLYGTTTKGAAGYGTIFRIVIPPAFQTVSLTNGGVEMTWSAISNQTYQLQYSTSLGSTNWSDLGSPATATNSSLSALDFPVPDLQRFYRIKLLQ